MEPEVSQIAFETLLLCISESRWMLLQSISGLVYELNTWSIVLSFGRFLTFLAWSTLLAGSFCEFVFWFKLYHHWSTSWIAFFYFYIANLTGTLNSLTVAPIGASFQFTIYTNPVMALFSAWQSHQCCKVLGFAWFWAFWAWYVILVSFLRLPECSGALFDWLWPSSFGCLPVSIDFTFQP